MVFWGGPGGFGEGGGVWCIDHLAAAPQAEQLLHSINKSFQVSCVDIDKGLVDVRPSAPSLCYNKLSMKPRINFDVLTLTSKVQI